MFGMPFGPVTLIFYWPQKKKFQASRLALISRTEQDSENVIILFIWKNVDTTKILEFPDLN
jgi:hypothetical protein